MVKLMRTAVFQLLLRRRAASFGRHDKRGRGILLLFAPACILLLAVYVIPMGRMIFMSLYDSGWTLSRYIRVLENPFILRILGNTIRLAAQVSLLCVFLGYPVAFLMLKSGTRVRHIVSILVILPIWTSILVRSYAWMVLLGRDGVINKTLQWVGLSAEPVPLLYNSFAVHVAMVQVLLPYMIFPLFSVMNQINWNLVIAARGLGAGPTSAFLWVFFPLTLPGVAAGTLLVFILGLGFFVTPALLGGITDVTYVMLIEKQVNELLHWEFASAMAVVLLIPTVILGILYQGVLGLDETTTSGAYATGRWRWLARAPAVGMALASRGMVRIRRTILTVWEERVRRRPNASALCAKVAKHGFPNRENAILQMPPLYSIIAWASIAFMVIPMMLLFPLSFSASLFLEFPPRGFSVQWFERYLSRSDWVTPTILSVKVAVLTMLIAVLTGSLAAIGLVRAKFRGKALLTAFFISPMILPTIIVAIAVYFQFARFHLIGSPTGLVLGHLILAVPMVIIVMMGALRSVDVSLEQAATSLGAGPVKAFLLVTLPLIRPAVATGAFFAFLASFDEVVIALFISGTNATTLPKRMWEGIRFEIDPTITAVSVVIVTLSVLLLLLAEIIRLRAGRTSGRS